MSLRKPFPRGYYITRVHPYRGIKVSSLIMQYLDSRPFSNQGCFDVFAPKRLIGNDLSSRNTKGLKL